MSFITDQELAGRIISIVGLGMAPFTTLFARHYSRTLYFVQLMFIASTTFVVTSTSIISPHYAYSWLDFMQSFTTNFCESGDFSCRYGELISPAIAWISGAALFFLIIKIVSCKKKEAKFLSFYNFYKGFVYWFFPPLIYFSIYEIIIHVQAQTTSQKDFYAGVIILVAFLVLFFAELIAYKCAQRDEQNKLRKWIQFFTHWVIGLTMACFAVYTNITAQRDTMKYLIPNVFLGIFFIFYIIGYKFKLKVFQRIMVIIQDALIIATLNIAVFKPEYIVDNHLDFWAVLVVAVIEMLQIIIKMVYFCKQGGIEDDQENQISPEKEGRIDKDRRNNSFAPGGGINPENSYDDLNNSSVIRRSNNNSPRRNPPPQPNRRR